VIELFLAEFTDGSEMSDVGAVGQSKHARRGRHTI
jgi:hypothetical protein